jgi:drug/metabolite transporter (DMT)-like permease
MPPIVFALVAVAAAIHATWNVIIKTSGDPLRTAARAVVGSVLVCAPFAVAAYILQGRPSIPSEAWVLAIASGLVEAVYFILLSAAYRRGDLSVVYPIARGSAPLFAVVVGVVVLGERLSPAGALGVASLLAGVVLVQRPWRILRTARTGDPIDRAVLFAFATGIAIATYSSIDSVGVSYVAPWLFASLLFPVGAAALALWVRFADRADVPEPAPWPKATVAGTLSLVGYLLILVAYSIAPLTIVAPLREAAVVLVAGWGSFRLREAASRGDGYWRVGGAVLVLAGALLVGLEG